MESKRKTSSSGASCDRISQCLYLALLAFALPGFGDETFKVNKSVTEKILQRASETTYVAEHSQSFMKKNNREGALYAEPV